MYNPASEFPMIEWRDGGLGLLLGAVALLFLVKYRHRPWLIKWRSQWF
jgi:hypothetical protein